MELNKKNWNSRYDTKETGWDIGFVSPPLKEYIDQITDLNIKILIPGCGNAYEAEYLFNKGFKNVFIVDYSQIAISNLIKRIPDFPNFLDKANYALQLIAEGKLNIGTTNNKSLEVEQMKLKGLRNNILISVLGVVIVILLVF